MQLPSKPSIKINPAGGQPLIFFICPSPDLLRNKKTGSLFQGRVNLLRWSNSFQFAGVQVKSTIFSGACPFGWG
jgi:hypothetical protein